MGNNNSAADLYEIDYKSVLKLGLSKKEITNFNHFFQVVSCELIKSEEEPYREEVFKPKKYEESKIFELTFKNGFLANADLTTNQFDKNYDKPYMLGIDTDLLGKTVDEAYEKYPSTFNLLKKYKLYPGGWRLESLDVSSRFSYRFTLTDLSKVITKTEDMYKIEKILIL